MEENFGIDYIPEPIAEPEILPDMPMTWAEEQQYKEKKKAKRLLITLSLLLVASLLLSTFSIIKAYSIPLIQGEQGIQGEKGERGEQGIQGIAGLNGLDGKDGKDGLDGKDGEKGEQGIQGIQGEKGLDGKDGKDGLTPYIKDGYWWIGNVNTGFSATADKVAEYKSTIKFRHKTNGTAYNYTMVTIISPNIDVINDFQYSFTPDTFETVQTNRVDAVLNGIIQYLGGYDYFILSFADETSGVIYRTYTHFK